MSYFGTIYADTELPSRGKMLARNQDDCVRHAIVTLHGQTGIDGSGAAWIPAKDPTLP